MVQRRAGRSEMALGQMQVDGSGLKVGMPEQRLHCRQIGSAFQQMRGETVPQGVLVLLMIWAQRKSAIAITRAMASKSR